MSFNSTFLHYVLFFSPFFSCGRTFLYLPKNGPVSVGFYLGNQKALLAKVSFSQKIHLIEVYRNSKE